MIPKHALFYWHYAYQGVVLLKHFRHAFSHFSRDECPWLYLFLTLCLTAWAPLSVAAPSFVAQGDVTNAIDHGMNVYIYAADLNGDGDMDVISASTTKNTIVWYPSDGNGGFAAEQLIASDTSRFKTVKAADLDGDGDLDLLSTFIENEKIIWYPNTDALGNFAAGILIAPDSTAGTNTIQVLDMDGDNHLDVFSTSIFNSQVVWYPNPNGTGSFAPANVIARDTFSSFYAVDIDGDGDKDVLHHSASGNDLMLYARQEDGLFAAEQSVFTEAARVFTSVYDAIDLDGDGDRDVLAAVNNDSVVVWYANDGSGAFEAKHVITQTAAVTDLIAIDLDNDGDIDMLPNSSNNDALTWYENDGQGGFAPQVISNLKAGRTHVADVNGDGALDILVAGFNDTSISLYVNQGNPANHPQISSHLPLAEESSVAADVNIALTFNTPMSQSSFDVNSSFKLEGSASGQITAGLFSGDNTTLIVFDPDTDFQAGETVTVTLEGVMSQLEASLSAPYSFQFTVLEQTDPNLPPAPVLPPAPDPTTPPTPIPTEQLTLSVTTVGGGSVQGAGTYPKGASVLLKALPTADWLFLSWSGDCQGGALTPVIGVLLDADKTCTAEFTQSIFAVTINVIGQGHIDGPRQSPPGNSITLNAVHAKDWLFAGWSGDCDQNGAVLMDADKNCTATFELPAANPAPPLDDLGATSYTTVTSNNVSNASPAVFARLDTNDVAALPSDAFQGVSAAHLGNLSTDGIRGLTAAQMENSVPSILNDLNTNSLSEFPPSAKRALTPEQVSYLNVTEFQAMGSTGMSGFMVNLDANKISPDDIVSLLPETWAVDLANGDLTAPIGSVIEYRPLDKPTLPPQLKMHSWPNLSAGFGVGGNSSKGSALTNLQATLDKNIDGFNLSQNTSGIMQLKTDANSQFQMAFVPDPNTITIVDPDATPGLTVDKGGFPLLTTDSGMQFRVLPSPNDPEGLASVMGTDSRIDVTEDSSVFMEYADSTRRSGRARRVMTFQSFVEPAPAAFYCMAHCGVIPQEQIAADLIPQLPDLISADCSCDASNFPANAAPGLYVNTPTQRRIGIGFPRDTREKSNFVYSDGTSQIVNPAFLEPDYFVQLLSAFDGIEATYNSNGTFTVIIAGSKYIVRPNFDVEVQDSGDSTPENPELQVNNDVFQYVVPYEDDTDSSTRRGRARQTVVSTPTIESIPDEFCSSELIVGRYICQFGEQYCEETSSGEWTCELSLDAL